MFQCKQLMGKEAYVALLPLLASEDDGVLVVSFFFFASPPDPDGAADPPQGAGAVLSGTGEGGEVVADVGEGAEGHGRAAAVGVSLVVGAEVEEVVEGDAALARALPRLDERKE